MATQNQVIDETRKVLELTEASEEKVCLLQRDLKQTENLYEQLTKELINVQNLKIKYSAELEDDHILKDNIKEYNEKLINFAQQIFSCGQKLYTENDSRESELDSIDKIFSTNEEKYLQKVKIHNTEEEKLKAELESFRKKNIEEKERRRRENENLLAENKVLTETLKALNDKLKQSERHIQEQETNFVEEEITLKEEIQNIKGNVKLKDVEINEVLRLLEEIEKDKNMSDAVFKESSIRLDKKIEENENEVVVAGNEFEEKEIQCNELLEKLHMVNMQQEDKKNIYKKQTDLLKEVEIRIEECITEIKKDNEHYDKITLEHEETRKLQQQLKTKLEMEIHTIKLKSETIENEITKSMTDIKNMRAKVSTRDLNKELESKRAELQQLKNTRHNLKQIYNEKLSAIQSEIEKLQGEISSIESNNKKLQQEIDKGENEIKQTRNIIDEKVNEKLNEEQLCRQFETQMQYLTKQIAGFKSEFNKLRCSSVNKEVHDKDLTNSASVEKKSKAHRRRDRLGQEIIH